MDNICDKLVSLSIDKNKGTGAGGANTTKTGMKFEHITDNEEFLLNKNFKKIMITKTHYYLINQSDNVNILWFKQNSFVKYIKSKYNIDVYRKPDEAFIIEDSSKDKVIIKIIEKKNQNVDGSVETKLYASPSLKREYQLMFKDTKYIIEYILCVNTFLFDKINSNHPKYINLNIILSENDIPIFNGNDDNYFVKINSINE
jgi:hypothetical protein